MNILVTGSSRGIGQAIVDIFRTRADPSADVRADPSADVRVLGHATRAAPEVLACDLAEPGAGERLWAAALDAFGGRIDVLVNNAGVFEAAPIDLPDAAWNAAWERTLAINLTASAALCRGAVAHFLARGGGGLARGGGGRIVNVASRAAYRGDSPAHWHYAASKAGMVGVTKSIARGYARDGILAFAVCPGFVMTGMAEEYMASRGGDGLLADIPLGRVATPGEVAEVVRFLALDAPASMTGAVLDVNGASYVR